MALAAYRGMWADMVIASRTSDYQSSLLPTHASGEALSVLVQGLAKNQEAGIVTKGEPVHSSSDDIAYSNRDSDAGNDHGLLQTTRTGSNTRATGGLVNNTPGGHHATTAIVVESRRRLEGRAVGGAGHWYLLTLPAASARLPSPLCSARRCSRLRRRRTYERPMRQAGHPSCTLSAINSRGKPLNRLTPARKLCSRSVRAAPAAASVRRQVTSARWSPARVQALVGWVRPAATTRPIPHLRHRFGTLPTSIRPVRPVRTTKSPAQHRISAPVVASCGCQAARRGDGASTPKSSSAGPAGGQAALVAELVHQYLAFDRLRSTRWAADLAVA